jgi:hypothetical protein
MLKLIAAVLLVTLLSDSLAQIPGQLVINGGFEQGLEGWQVTGQAGYTSLATQNTFAGTSSLATRPLTRPDYSISIPTRQGARQEIGLAQSNLDLELSFAARVENHNSRTEVRVVLLFKGNQNWAIMYFLAYEPGFVQSTRYSNQTARSIFLADINPSADPQWNTWLVYLRDVKADLDSSFGLGNILGSGITSIEIWIDTIAYGSTFNTDVTTWDEISLVQRQTVQTTIPVTTFTQQPTPTTIQPTTTQTSIVVTTITLPSPPSVREVIPLSVIAVGVLVLVAALLAVYIILSRRKS